MTVTTLLLTLFAVALGYAAAYLIESNKRTRIEERNRNLDEQLQSVKKESEREINIAAEKLEAEQNRTHEAEKSLAILKTEYQNVEKRLSEQKQEMEKLQEKFRDEFKNLANEILDEKSKKFTEHNRENLDQLLKPLGEKISEFQKRVEKTHQEDIKGRSALEQHLKSLQELNQNMTEEAKNLTKALKGDSKQQGNWGEVILQRILEKSGLRKGHEYETQESTTLDDGRRLQPDVVVKLPDEKRLIIDSKVSLKDYEAASSADDSADREKSVKKHVQSLKNHVKNLHSKNYRQIYGMSSPDFVLMFIPVEPAFGLAMQVDPQLYNDAFEKNIIIVSPTTLLATLATIDNVWKQEYQNRNAAEIARRGGLLYDKFVGFVENLEEIGNRIRQSRHAYDRAMGQLSTGAGNLVGQAEKLRGLGASVSKKLPDSFSEEEEEKMDD